MLDTGRCMEARDILRKVPAARMSEDWYQLEGMADIACWSRSHAAADKDAALAAVADGLSRYPESAALVAEKGAIYETTGDVIGARALYQLAYVKAAANLEKNPQSRMDRDVLERTGRRLQLAFPAPLRLERHTRRPSREHVE
jgi:hypothetical protein